MGRDRRRFLAVLLACAALVAVTGALVFLSGYVDRRMKAERSGPVHVFMLGGAPRFLTDELALEHTRRALALDGYDLAAWEPLWADQSKAPDGTPDRYLARNGEDPNAGTVRFVNMGDSNPTRIVQVELKGERLECRIVIPK